MRARDWFWLAWSFGWAIYCVVMTLTDGAWPYPVLGTIYAAIFGALVVTYRIQRALDQSDSSS